MRVLLICSEQPPIESGVARAIHHLTTGLRDRGHRVDVLSGADGTYWENGEFRLNTLALRWRSVHATLSDYDVVNVHGPAPTISDAYLALLRSVRRSRRPRVVYTHHFTIDLDHWRRSARLYDSLHRRIARLADQVVVSSRSYQRMLSSRHGPPVAAVPWGVDLDRFAGKRLVEPYDGARPLRVLFVGQMRPYKGIGETIRAVAGQPALELTLVGKGRLREQFEAITDSTNVRFVGSLSDADLTLLYRSHDVIVKAATNRLEAFGLVLVEGMAAGCLPVTSDIPGVRDLAAPTGRIVRAGDVDALRSELVDLAAQPDLVRDLQRRSRAHARGYSWRRTIESYERIFRGPVPGVIDLTANGATATTSPDGTQIVRRLPTRRERIKVLYIGGTGRTGSTLLEGILGQFDGVFNAGELAFLWRYGLYERGRCSCGSVLAECPTWLAILDAAYGSDGLDPQTMIALRRRFNSRHLPLMVTPGLRRRLLERSEPFPSNAALLYGAIRATTGSSLIIDSSKEPHYSYILKSQPGLDLYFLHLVRDPRAVAYSWRRQRPERGVDHEVFMERRGCLKSAMYFDVSNVAAEAIWHRHADRYLRLRYEDFALDPAGALEAIGSFVGETLDVDGILDGDRVVLAPTHSAWGNPNRFRHGPAEIHADVKWATALPTWRRLAATSLTYPLMRRYGYGAKPPTSEGLNTGPERRQVLAHD
jgi:rhamnosyl/mannosyltransferase